jgi:hypothetical protein
MNENVIGNGLPEQNLGVFASLRDSQIEAEPDSDVMMHKTFEARFLITFRRTRRLIIQLSVTDPLSS